MRMLKQLWDDEAGMETFEYALLLAFVVLPLVRLAAYLVDMLRQYYSLSAFTVTLPFP